MSQPRRGYRAGVDPVLLAASVGARAGESLLDLGCGAGTAALCAGRRVPGLVLAGLERQAPYAALARRNAADNGLEMTVHEGDLAQMPEALRQCVFDHVIANPPYFRRTASSPAQAEDREAAMGEETPLDTWVEMAARRCKPKGHVTFIHRAERLPELLAAFEARLGSIELMPLVPRPGRESQLVLLRGRKGGRAAFRLHAGLLLHRSATHEGDREDYTEAAQHILRDGAALVFDR
ncbi:methyltransferase [Pseudooceanicola sp. CBS1P-1]|uniref:Methyltransferase n=1 Tax=Pseudooceanicola albus TaxID=2692189 RepID=A0A6L7G3S2_9RHOB|nr:methyltransferase [Pseudooceanicola endophyticus]MXN18168.1 methyltransferase [Pseudooceanicola albus]